MASQKREDAYNVNAEIANHIENILLSHVDEDGSKIVIHRYDAKTGSIYLKLDWGAAWSIRIADHNGYKNLSYRFNIGHGVPAIHITQENTYARWWFPDTEVQKLCEEILTQRQSLIDQYGLGGYHKRMAVAKARSKDVKFYRHPDTHTVTGTKKKKNRTSVKF